MKYGSTFRILLLAIVLSTLVIAIPVTPVQAQTLSVIPVSGHIGTTLTIGGEGFTSGDNYEITFAYGTPFAQLVDSGQVTGSSLSLNFSVPAVPRGNYIIHASYVHSGTPGTSSPSFTVTPQIALNTSSGYVDDQITVSGTGFRADSSVDIYFDTINIGAVITDDHGTFTNTTIIIPESYSGNHTLKGNDKGGYSPEVSFTTLPKITIIPGSGDIGDQVTISGAGFAGNEEVNFYLDDEIISASATTNAKGSFIINTLTIPPASLGSHAIKAEDASNNSATATFSTTGQTLTITPPSSAPGTTVTVTGNGFNANTAISIQYNYTIVATNPTVVNTDSKGSFTATFTVPAGLAGTYPVMANDGTNSANAVFIARTDATISQETSAASPGHIGMEVTITGAGFKRNATVTITYTSEPVVLATVTTDINGAFSATFTIPPSIGGNHIITATDGYTTKQFIFVVESEAPPIPAPLRPETGTKAKAGAYLDWGDVNDPSGVTYTLQIASDAAFTTTVLEKEGLADSEYTLTKEERLPAVKKNAPYYWRVKAIDKALNEGEWSAPRSFYVGFLFTIPDWAMYILLIFGAAFFTYLGFLWGRKTSY